MFAAKNELFTRPSGGFVIPRSLRFRASASAYLNRTFASDGNRKTFTWSSWIKIGQFSTNPYILSSGGASTPEFICSFSSGNALNIGYYNGASYTYRLLTTQVFRDPSAWYHIVVAWDTTQATASNRIKVYVNGVQVTAFDTASYPSLNYDSAFINTTSAQYISSSGSGEYFDGYLAEVNFIDGQALTPTSFGTTSTITGVWSPINYGGTYGTNGYHLTFNSYATQAALGTDTSGNSNTWTVNGCSVTAGVTYDSMIDVPTVTDTGSNYAVWNPNDSGLASGSITISQGNLHVVGTGGGDEGVAGSIAIDIGGTTDYVWEIKIAALVASFFGIMPASTSGVDSGRTGQRAYYPTSGQKYSSGTASAYATTSGAGDVMGFVIGNGSITVYKNGTSLGVMFSGLTDYWKPFMVHNNTYTIDANFGQQGFAYPSSYGSAKALNTYNLATPSILKGNEYMDATTYTGTGASLSVTNAGGFQPGFVWAKSRSAATDHALYDSVRGTTKQIESNTTDAETTEATGLTAFNSTGFTVGALAQMNTSAATYVGWQWKAGSTVTNTSGSITSSVSASAASGFSVVTYTGNGTNGSTIGHGIGVAPSMIIVKSRSAVDPWPVYHTSIGNTQSLRLNSTAAVVTASFWNDTTAGASVFTVGGGVVSETNTTSVTYVAYCFAPIAGYSAFGSYVANNSTDGPFVYLGFRPRFIMFKDISGAADWEILDTTRSPYNLATAELKPNTAGAETTATSIDYLSNGFKLRAGAADPNNLTHTYIYAAFAENPFNNSLAR